MLKHFYGSYIVENARIPPNFARIDSIKAKYCTRRLLHKIKEEGLDYDPFLKAQDSNIEWLKTLSIKGDSKESNVFYISYVDTFNGDRVEIKVIVVKDKDLFKIDSIL